MRLVASSKSLGNAAAMYPRNPDGTPMNVEEIPSDLHSAIEYALKILSWHENLPEEDIPKQWMWPLDHELEKWFAEVKRKRAEKYGSSKSGSSDEVTDLEGDENILYTRMKDEFTRQLREGPQR